MKNSLLILAFIFLLVCQGQSQDIKVNFNGENALIDSVIATNLTTGESIKMPGNAILTLRQNPTGIKIIPLDKGNLSVFYPTFGKTIVINYSSWFSQEIIIRLTDISGRILAQKKITTTRGINQFKISTKHFGLYFISLQTGENCYNAKFVSKGLGSNDIHFFGVEELKDSDEPLKSGIAESFVLLFSSGDIISYEFYSGKSITVINEEAGASNVLSPEFYECVDYDGNSYSIVKIGDQWWMAENLGSERYAEGAELYLCEDNDLWSRLLLTEKAYSFYNNDKSLDYGALYSYVAAVNRTPYVGSEIKGICPNGWHVPSNDEWKELQTFMIGHGYNYDGTLEDNKIGKSLASTSGWIGADREGEVGYNQSSNNASGFNAKPAGFRGNETGLYQHEGISGNWWSSSEYSDSMAYGWSLSWDEESLVKNQFNIKTLGLSVRCIRNEREYQYANFLADKTVVKVGEVVTFTDISNFEPTEWYWDFGDCHSSTERNPNHIYSSPGTYTVQVSFKTINSSIITEIKKDYINVMGSEKRMVSDYEENKYKTVKIGNQLWMAENLASTSYSDGAAIPHISDNAQWGALAADNTAKAYSFYNNDKSLGYGALYTYAAAVNGTPFNGSDDVQGVCPDGWHIPAETEWDELENYLVKSGYNFDGSTVGNKISKSMASASGWNVSIVEGAIGNNQSTNNRSGFNGMPGGYRSFYSTSGEFAGEGEGGYWWMANDVFEETAMYWNLYYDYKHVLRDYTFKRTGLCVRCLKNDDGSPLADFTSDITEVKLGNPVTFNDLSTNNPNKWIWNFDECETSEEQNPIYRFNRNGLHHVTLIASNSINYDVVTKENFINVIQNKSVINDIEGNFYQTVEIGNQWWMAENLKTTKLNNGTDIPLATEEDDWLSASASLYGWFENDKVTYGNTYGALYNWHAVNTGNLCPAGWHVPTDNDWKELELSLGMSPLEVDSTGYRGKYQGSKLADNADLWRAMEPDKISDIEKDRHFGYSGFKAIPGSFYPGHVSMYSPLIGTSGYMWSSSEFNSDKAWYRALIHSLTGIHRENINKKSGLSVRCIKD